MIDSSNSSKESGNTRTDSLIVNGKVDKVKKNNSRQVSPAIRWCFTLNNWTEEELSSIVPICKTECSKYIIGKEVGEEGTPHLQGFLKFKNKKRPKGLFNTNRIHWEKAKGTDKQNFDYCSKEGNFFFLGFLNH